MSKVIILNGPPRSGKDAIVEEMVHSFEDMYGMSFKRKLIELALCMSGVSEYNWSQRYSERSLIASSGWKKDEPWGALGGMSQRNYLIWLSEDVVKQMHGNDYFGQALVRGIISEGTDNDYVISDGGFIDEVQPLIDDPNIDLYIVKLYRSGCSFDGDSRNYIPRKFLQEKGIPCLELHNDKTILGAVGKISDWMFEQRKGE